MTWWYVYLLVFLSTAAVGFLCTRFICFLGHLFGVLDQAGGEAHKQHSRDVPQLGGIALLIGCVGTLAAGFAITPLISSRLAPEVAEFVGEINTAVPELTVITGGVVAMTLLGLADDMFALSAIHKLLGQIVIAALAAALGSRITLFIDNPWITWALTALWIVVVINAINFFDNMDGQAAGTALVGGLVFFVAAAYREQFFVASLSAAVCGVCLGFLFLNWPPAKIFMGDSGSHFLGFCLAVLGIKTTFFEPGGGMTLAALLIPLLALALPLFDLGAVVVIRFRQGRPVYVGDKWHISHRFSRMGLDEKQTAVVIHLLSAAIGAGALTLLWLPFAGACLVLIQTAAVLGVVSILHILNPPLPERGSN